MSRESLRNAASYPAIVGQVLSNLRKNINIDQSEFAEIIGVTQSTWSRIERGASAFTIEQLADAADHLNLTPSEILELADQAALDLQNQGVEIYNEKISEGIDKGLIVLGAAALGIAIAALIGKSK